MRNIFAKTCIILLPVLYNLTATAQAPASNKPDPAQIQVSPGTHSPQPIPAAYSAAFSPNYVRTRTAVAPIRTEADFDAAGYREVKQTTQYLDGLGRPLQVVSRQATPGTNPRDLVAPAIYNKYGQEEYNFLPHVSQGIQNDDGSFKISPFVDQDQFYKSIYTDAGGKLMYAGEEFLYGQTELEPSPLNRVKMTKAPDNSWVGSNRGIAQEYLINTAADGVILWNFSDLPFNTSLGPVTSIPFSKGGSSLYEEGRLYKNVTKDEHDNATVEYRNMEGQIILKKVQIQPAPFDYSGYDGWLCTYYVYDDLGMLRFVIPPKAVEWLRLHNWEFIDATEADQVIAELCFRYQYDERRRMTAKKVPGAGWVYMIYDLRNRLVFTQDANLRLKNYWNATVYDDQNRTMATGLFNYDLGLETMRNTTSAISFDFTLVPAFTLHEFYVLSVTHHDNYVWITRSFGSLYSYTDAYNAKLDASANPYPETLLTIAEQKNGCTKGLVTGTDIGTLSDPAEPYSLNAISTLNYYDLKGRLIQTRLNAYSNGTKIRTDISTNRYDFTGNIICNYTVHINPKVPAGELRAKTNIDYDHSGRLLNIWKTIDDQENKKALIVRNEYDDLGQLRTKELGQKRRDDGTYNPASAVEKHDYQYNIRGWLRGINAGYSHPELNNGHANGRWFGMELNYDWGSTDAINNQYNGNISMINWRSKGDGVQRSYGYSYDQSNRLLGADYSERAGSVYADNPDIMFDAMLGDGKDPASAYDPNGNILSMTQWGLKPTGSLPIDKLAYSYYDHSNKLKAVTEDAATSVNNHLSDFTDNHTGAEDYGYDLNGNMIADLNKHMNGSLGTDQTGDGSIVYNYLNLPWKITMRDAGNNTVKGTITYTYDATGSKTEKRVLEYPSSSNNHQQKETVTTYMGAFVYEQVNSDPVRLQFISHEEGRIRISKGQGQHADYSFDYFIKDHLGNVRMVLTDELAIDAYPALSFEGDERALAEQQHFWDDQNNRPLQISAVRTPRPGNFGDDNSNGSYAMLVRKSTGSVGAAKLLKVMSGDRIHTSVEYYYSAAHADNSVADGIGSLVTSIASALSVSSQAAGILKEQSSAITSTLQRNAGLALMLNDPVSTQGGSQAPKAYLNILFFDEQFRFDEAHSIIIPVSYQPDRKGIIDRRLSNAAEAPKNGYVYVYFSNESNEMVYFDNFILTHERGPLLEETHYYPFGLTMQGISSKAAGSVENRKKYNGIEFNDDLDLDMYDAFYRNLDPQTGRWWQIDPKVDAGYESISPYASMYDDPIRYSDPLGDEADDFDGGPGGPIMFGPGSLNAVKKVNDAVVEGARKVLVAAGGVLNGALNTLSLGTWGTNPAEAILGSNTMTTGDQESYSTAVVLGQDAAMVTSMGRGLNPMTSFELAPLNGPKVSLPKVPFLPTGDRVNSNFAEGSNLSSNAARRDVMRKEGIPTSQQPTKQKQTSAGRVLEYEIPKPGGGNTSKQVQQQLKDRNHGPHWEAGTPKKGGQKDPVGRNRLENGKSKSNYNE